jgi:hypothetical protein
MMVVVVAAMTVATVAAVVAVAIVGPAGVVKENKWYRVTDVSRNLIFKLN